MLVTIISAFVAVGVLGALFGIGLAVASRFLAVRKDKRVEEVEEVLPGLNCGACGYAGCPAYAEAIVENDETLDLCKPGGQATMEKLGKIMGVEVEASSGKWVTQVHCRGGVEQAKYKFEYEGLQDCNAAYALYGGPKVCEHGCLGLGSCVKVCPVDAIDYDDIGLVWVDRDICISCGKCVDICPTNVMRWVPYDADRIVACNSTDKGGVVRKYCKVGCIGCKRCEKASPDGGFEVIDFLARIDYSQKGERKSAEEACPTNCIIKVVPEVMQEEEVAVASESDEND